MNRNKSIGSFIPNGVTQTFLPGMRGPSILDHDKEEFEKNQLVALTKCLSLEEGAAKEKHVRTLIIGTFKTGGPQIFWQKVKDNIPLHSNDVVCWKFLIVLHRLMQDGHSNVPKASRSYCAFIDEIVNSHKQAKSAYGKLSYSYGGLIISKLLFHAKYPNIPGNLTIKDQSIVKNDAANSFELAIDFLDLLERIIKVKRIILNTFDPGKSHSSTSSGQCRLSALVPCINDSARLFDLLSKTLKILHYSLPWDTLEGHRQRFKLQYAALEDLYEKLDHFYYLKSMANIPRLSGNLKEFMSSLHRMPDVPEPPFDEGAAAMEPETPDGPGFEQDLITVDEGVDSSLAYVQQEYGDLSVKYQTLIHRLEEEQGLREAMEREFASKEQKWMEEMERLKTESQEMVLKHRESLEMTAIAATNNHTTEANEEKLEKLKAAYQKLRNDHIVLLRQKAELAKNQDLSDVNSWLAAQNLKPLSSKSDLLQFIKTTLTENREKDTLINQLENEKRFLDLDCSEKNLVMKEELENLRRRDLPELRERVQALQNEKEKLEKESENVARSWKDRNLHHFGLLAKRLASSSLPPQFESIFGPAGSNLTPCDSAPGKLARMQDIIFFITFAVMQLQPLETNDDLGDLIKSAERLCQIFESGDSEIENDWENFVRHTKLKLDTVGGTSNYDPADEVEKEIYEMQESINEAAKAMEKLMVEAKANEANKPNLDVDLKIIDSCSTLLIAVQEMIKSARHLQREITQESNGRKLTSMTSAKEHYKKNQKWSEGLISAAKDIGGGAKLLVDSADQVVHGEGKFEELIAASQEIAGSTAQLVIASKVKARQDSQNLTELKATSKSVAESTAQVIATCRACSSEDNQEANVDLNSLSVHQSKRLEMEIQIKVLQLETQLEKQRKQLFDLRKLQYANSAKTEGATES